MNKTLFICLCLFVACNRHPVANPSTNQGSNATQTMPKGLPTSALADSQQQIRSDPLPFDSTQLTRLLSMVPSKRLYQTASQVDARLYELACDDMVYVYPSYLVRYTDLHHDLASKCAVYLNGGASDSAAFIAMFHSKPLFAFDGDAEYFIAMLDHFLFTDVGTSLDRGVKVYDVRQRRSVYSGHYVDSVWFPSHDTLAYFEIVHEPPDSTKYPEVRKIIEQGNTPVLLEFVKVSLSNFSKVHTRQFKLGALD